MKYIILPFTTLLLFITLTISSCYNQKKAFSAFSRAVAFDPALGPGYCAAQFPSRDSVIRDTITNSDTLFIEGAERLDTVTINDTIRITKTIQLPAKVVTNTIYVIDTVYRENTAAVKACQIDNSRLIASTGILTGERDKARHSRDNWRIIALISLAVNGIGLFFKLKKIIPWK